MANDEIVSGKQGAVLQMLLFGSLCVFYAWVSHYFWYHNDLGWHLAAGDLIIGTRSIPATDPWSYLSAGVPWYNLSWLWDVLASLIFRYAGGLALLGITVAIGVSTICLLAALSLNMGARPGIILVLAVFVGAAFPFYKPPDIFLCVAPQQMTLLFSALLLTLLWRFQHHQRLAFYVAVPLIFTVWCNMHGGFVIGQVILALMTGASFLRSDKALASRLAILLTLSILAVLVNPYGFHLIDGLRGTLGHITQRKISEWQPLFKDFDLTFALPSLIYTALFLLALSQKPAWKGKTPFHVALTILSVLLLVKGILVLRYFSLFLLFSLPVTSLGITSIAGKFTRSDTGSEPQITLLPAGIAAVFIVIATLYIIMDQNPDPNAMADARDPKQEIQFIMAHYPHARLFNQWNFGSFIIYEGRGRLSLFIDGRSGTAYPDSVFIDLLNFYQTRDWGGILQKYRVDTILWPVTDKEMLAWFDHHPEWRVVFTGRLAVVLVKTDKPGSFNSSLLRER